MRYDITRKEKWKALGFLCIDRAVLYLLQGLSQVYIVTLTELFSVFLLRFPSAKNKGKLFAILGVDTLTLLVSVTGCKVFEQRN